MSNTTMDSAVAEARAELAGARGRSVWLTVETLIALNVYRFAFVHEEGGWLNARHVRAALRTR